MNVFSVLTMTVTMIMTAVMIPRIYMSWIIVEECRLEGETGVLPEVLDELNSWVWRHFGCGSIAIAMIWMVNHSKHDLKIPHSMEAALACYAVVSMLFAVAESLIAQKVSGFIEMAPVAVKVRGEN